MTKMMTTAGEYTPLLAAVQNVDASSVPYDGSAIWTRVGNIVTVTGIARITPKPGNNVYSIFDLSLPSPVASGQDGRLAGIGSIVVQGSSTPVSISKSGSMARMRFNSLNSGAVDVNFVFSYLTR